jgi:hypothetical protein
MQPIGVRTASSMPISSSTCTLFNELLFAGHINDMSNDDLLAFLDQAGFLLVDRKGNILASSNGETKDDYVRDRPLHHVQSLLSYAKRNNLTLGVLLTTAQYPQ